MELQWTNTLTLKKKTGRYNLIKKKKKKATEHTRSVCEEASYYNCYTILKIEHIKKKKKFKSFLVIYNRNN